MLRRAERLMAGIWRSSSAEERAQSPPNLGSRAHKLLTNPKGETSPFPGQKMRRPSCVPTPPGLGFAGSQADKLPTSPPAEALPDMSHRFDPAILREYDIRGIVGANLFAADAKAIGRVFAALLAKEGGRRVAV